MGLNDIAQWTLIPTYTVPSYLFPTAGDNNAKAIAQDTLYVYSAPSAGVAKAIKLLKTDLSLVTSTDLTGGDFLVSMVSDGTAFVFGVTAATPGKVYKLDRTTFAVSATLTLNAGEGPATRIMHDGTYLYVLCGTSPSRLVMVDPAAMTRLGAYTFPAGENLAASIDYDTLGNVYVGLPISPGRVVKLARNTGVPSRTTQWDAPAGYDEAVCAFDRLNSGYLFVGYGGNSMSFKPQLARVNSLVAPMVTLETAFGMDPGPTATFLWKFRQLVAPRSSSDKLHGLAYETSTTFGRLVEFNTGWFGGRPGQSLRVSRTSEFNSGNSNADQMASDGRYLFVGTATSPGQVLKWDRLNMGLRLFVPATQDMDLTYAAQNEQFLPINDNPLNYLNLPITRSYGRAGEEGSLSHIVPTLASWTNYYAEVKEHGYTMRRCNPFAFVHDFGDTSRAKAIGAIRESWKGYPGNKYCVLSFDFHETSIGNPVFVDRYGDPL